MVGKLTARLDQLLSALREALDLLALRWRQWFSSYRDQGWYKRFVARVTVPAHEPDFNFPGLLPHHRRVQCRGLSRIARAARKRKLALQRQALV